jgi:hypothetical protein
MRAKPAAFVGLLLAAAPIWAHHGSTGFDQNKPVHFVGKISQIVWSNPHVVVHVDVTGPDGKAATWLVNTLPPNTAKRLGFPESSFSVGAEITVDGYQAIDGSNHVNGTNIAFPDGRKITSPDCFDNGPHCFKPADGKVIRLQ